MNDSINEPKSPTTDKDSAGCGCWRHDATNLVRSRADVIGRVERRTSIRRLAKGSAVAVFTEPGEGKLVTRVDLVDACVRGLGLRSPIEVPLGVEIKLHFNGQVLPGRSGMVVRCDEDAHGGGYHIGLNCDTLVAAA